METIRQISKNPIAVGIMGLVVGLFFGLVVLGWWLWPVEWVDANPEHLQYQEKVSYLRQAIEAYGYNGDISKAVARYNALGEDATQALADITAAPGDMNPDIINAFTSSVLMSSPLEGIPVEPGAESPLVEPPEGEAPVVEEPAKEEGGGFSTALLVLLCLVVLVVIGAAVYYFFLRNKFGGDGKPSAAMQADEARRQASYTDYASTGSEPPIAQFMASYHLGDDLFDDSFSIDSASGEFLGECGVGISETIGVGDPKKVTAFEVWLFDKNDIQTVTTVLMSDNAYHDVATRQRLQPKGELALVQEGGEVVLDTQTLQLVARVVNMEYGDGALPEQSYFKTFLIELAVWPKEEI
ncbi:MAG TPA: hypothetical protein VLM80_03980 [Anaerolineales bacterium]|nr:hypothetical protein [Anaerolineales bacterium]